MAAASIPPEAVAFMKILAIGNQVIIRRDPPETATAAGIIKPEAAQERPCAGTVLSVGDGLCSELTGQLMPTSLHKGQRVMFPKFAGNLLPGLTDVIVMSEREILAVLDEGEEIG